jgi:hypothetical protein
MPRKRTVETHEFRKGQKLTLDEIYNIQGLAGGNWWTAPDPADGAANEEEVTITRDITIRIETW